jgi:hypothetical protein
MNYFKLIDSIYTKRKCEEICNEDWINIQINKCISRDAKNCSIVRSIIDYLFFIEPLHYFYLLFFNIQLAGKAPYFAKIEKQEIKEDKLENKIKYILNWSQRELNKNRIMFNKLIQSNQKYWKEELGITR